VAEENKAPFKSVLTHGFVMDGEGRPMSKSLGNVIAPEEIIKQYGADILRFWVASSDYGGDVRISPEILKGLSDSYRKLRNTFRYLLNNLGDFDPGKDSVPYEKLAEIDRWVLHRLQEEIRDAIKAYDEYQFHRVAGRLVIFCNADLSSFYLDVIKDRLYCDPAGSKSRRAAQTVLYQLSDSLFRLLAPVLSFTTDECWRFLGRNESVSISDMPISNKSIMDNDLMKRWELILGLRTQILKKIEIARAAGTVKAPREVKAIVTVKNLENVQLLTSYVSDNQLSGIMSISAIDLIHVEDLNDIWTIDIQKVEGKKCERCWIYKKDVGVKANRPDICGRCADAVQEWEKLCAV
jgi:isoleucyl-tRNA synthetase